MEGAALLIIPLNNFLVGASNIMLGTPFVELSMPVVTTASVLRFRHARTGEGGCSPPFFAGVIDSLSYLR